ncbi:MAG: hypothetical protein A2Y10_06050 [Planctomycetes bacterium GWF2_41_51]|nr:MAG: hypothetical protein A2Y10_06050 [Planctomycetes bacterium GWF2_41_51]
MNNETIYHLLGKISIAFASLEHGMVYLLEYLLTKEECSLVAVYILHGMSISKLIEKVRLIAKIRLLEHKAVFAKLEEILDNIDEFREQRNLFIHGNWHFNEEPADNADSVTVVNYKPKLDKKSGKWECLKYEHLTKTELNQLFQDVATVLSDFRKIDTKIRHVKFT